MLSFFIQHLFPGPFSLTASSLGTKSRCPIPRRPITLQNESAEASLLCGLSSAFPSPLSTTLRTAGRGKCGVKAGIGGGDGGGVDGGDGGGGVGQGEGRSRSGARVADDSSVSSKRTSGFLLVAYTWRKDVGKGVQISRAEISLKVTVSRGHWGWQCHIRQWHNRLKFRLTARKAASRQSKEHMQLSRGIQGIQCM